MDLKTGFPQSTEASLTALRHARTLTENTAVSSRVASEDSQRAAELLKRLFPVSGQILNRAILTDEIVVVVVVGTAVWGSDLMLGVGYTILLKSNLVER